MAQFSSTLQILAVENEEKVSQRTGNKYRHFAARCVLLDDDGQVVTVGTLRSQQITTDLRDQIKPGVFRAVFSLQSPDYGDNKGDIVSILTGLSPARAAAPVAAPAASK